VPADLSRDTAVHRLDQPGAYGADLPHDWSYVAPSGGVLMTVALRAMAEEVADPAFRLLSATALFCSRVHAGPIRVAVDVLRRGNAAVQVRGALSGADAAEVGFEVSATFARDRDGPSLVGAVMPAAAPPGETPPLEERARHPDRRRIPFFGNFEWRSTTHRPYWEPGGSADEPRVTHWVRYLVPQRVASGEIDPLAIPPLADSMPPSVAQKLGPGHTPFDAPSLDLTVHFLEPARGDWLLVSTRARHARGGYASAEAEIWSEEGRLVAYATQTMILRRRQRG
jgi:acyl-CoA thioesterase